MMSYLMHVQCHVYLTQDVSPGLLIRQTVSRLTQSKLHLVQIPSQTTFCWKVSCFLSGSTERHIPLFGVMVCSCAHFRSQLTAVHLLISSHSLSRSHSHTHTHTQTHSHNSVPHSFFSNVPLYASNITYTGFLCGLHTLQRSYC